MVKAITVLFLLCALCASQQSSAFDDAAILKKAHLDRSKEVPILYLRGTPYEMGYQQGKLLAEEVENVIDGFLRFLNRELTKRIKIPLISRPIINIILDVAYWRTSPFIPEDYKEEMRGLAEGSGVSLRNIQRIHIISELFYIRCSSFAAFGEATRGGRLYHTRVFDWIVGSGIEENPIIIIYEPEGKHPFVSIGYAGYIGVLSGMNIEGISVAQIGAKTVDKTLRGVPMPFLLRKVLEESDNLEEATKIVRDAPRTVGHNYVFADAKAAEAIVLETTANLFAVFRDNDPKEKEVVYAIPLPNIVFRADAAMDPEVRDRQICDKGDPKKPGLELPYGSGSYEHRYKGQARLLKEYYGRIDEAVAKKIVREVAMPKSNLKMVIYSFPEFWVALLEKGLPVAERKFRNYNLKKLLPIKQENEK